MSSKKSKSKAEKKIRPVWKMRETAIGLSRNPIRKSCINCGLVQHASNRECTNCGGRVGVV